MPFSSPSFEESGDPCPGCEHWSRCKESKLACAEYAVWATGSSHAHELRQAETFQLKRVPTRLIYKLVFHTRCGVPKCTARTHHEHPETLGWSCRKVQRGLFSIVMDVCPTHR